MKRLSLTLNLLHNMGLRYTAFRARHEFMRRTGLLKSKFPVAPPMQSYLSLADWKAGRSKFFFASREDLNIPKQPDATLVATWQQLQQGNILMFNSVLMNFGTNYNWVTNPDTGYQYDNRKHWTEIPDYSTQAGDIKYVWEKSRFSYLYDIIRHDYHNGEDCAATVIADILSWIEHNPINCGPNYRCSQEMSLRVLNWTFALHYYSNSPLLKAEVFDKIQHVIYWHLHHIWHNIHFSRIAVRNNHAITETLTLYLGALLYPTFPGAANWKKWAKKWFEEEIAYQLYPDGTFLQFSMNYHRVVVQLLTWAFTLAEKNGEQFAPVVRERAIASLRFLRVCTNDAHGWLPNYGANDGALFFRLSTAHYRDYRPQLHALASVLGIDAHLPAAEDVLWYTNNAAATATVPLYPNGLIGSHSFTTGGYYIIREANTLTFLRCGNHKDRPSQADNLHLDIWHNNENLLIDAGSYKYNADADTIRYFSGTRSHNTVMLAGKDQMLKGGRFIWYYWTQAIKAALAQSGNQYTFSGTISAFQQVGSDIQHHRTVTKTEGQTRWIVRDELTNLPAGTPISQLWHLPPDAAGRVRITAKTASGEVLKAETAQGWASEMYGARIPTTEQAFAATTHIIETIIEIEPV